MNEDGTFTLCEPYATMLMDVRLAATNAWTQAILSELTQRSDYTPQELKDELLRRSHEDGISPTEIIDEFILEALTGDL